MNLFGFVFLGESLPRYVRVNLLKTTVDAVIQTLTRDGYTQVINQTRSYNEYLRFLY